MDQCLVCTVEPGAAEERQVAGGGGGGGVGTIPCRRPGHQRLVATLWCDLSASATVPCPTPTPLDFQSLFLLHQAAVLVHPSPSFRR